MKNIIVKFPGGEFDLNTGEYQTKEGRIVHFSNSCDYVVILSAEDNKFHKVHIVDLKYVKEL